MWFSLVNLKLPIIIAILEFFSKWITDINNNCDDFYTKMLVLNIFFYEPIKYIGS